MERKHLIVVVDMQIDFIDGSLATPGAQEIIQPICQLIDRFEDSATKGNNKTYYLVTKDTHDAETYLDSPEGKDIPVLHCIKGTRGHNLNEEILSELLSIKPTTLCVIEKKEFKMSLSEAEGFTEVTGVSFEDVTDVHVFGLITDVCVEANALLLKELCKNATITVYENLCKTLTFDAHIESLARMEAEGILIARA